MLKHLLAGAAICAFMSTPALSQVPYMVKDIRSGSNASFPEGFADLDGNGNICFIADDGTNGKELWRSDGTVNGTVMVKDGIPGSGSLFGLYHSIFFRYNNFLLFFTDDGVNGSELWRTDGTDAGTYMIKDINPGAGSSNSFDPQFTLLNGSVLFSADDGTNGIELWKTDGTASGTVMVKDINPGNNMSNPYSLCAYNGYVYFMADDNVNGYELWRSDGTNGGTTLFKEIANGSLGGSPNRMTVSGGLMYFVADDQINGGELWKSDGTSAGTVMVKDIYTGSFGSSIFYMVDMNGILYFGAADVNTEAELWRSDGTDAGTYMVKECNPGPFGCNPTDFTVMNNKLYFVGYTGTAGFELWSSDGTNAGTNMVMDIRAGSSSGLNSPNCLTAYYDRLYFLATDANGKELWITDGTTTQMVYDIFPGFGPGFINYSGTAVSGNHLYFNANNSQNGIELWSLELPPLSVNTIRENNTMSVYPNPVKHRLNFNTNGIVVADAQVYDSFGRNVGLSVSENQMDVSTLSSGMYHLVITDKSGKSYSRRFVKE